MQAEATYVVSKKEPGKVPETMEKGSYLCTELKGFP